MSMTYEAVRTKGVYFNNTTTNIDISNYLDGYYTVALVCNGQIVDAKTLIKQ